MILQSADKSHLTVVIKCASHLFFCIHSAKIKNIEETEGAKQKLIIERMTKKEDVSEFVPSNMAVNFVQHNRCKLLMCRLTVQILIRLLLET